MKRTLAVAFVIVLGLSFQTKAFASSEFFDSFLSINFNGGFGFPFGPIVSEERDAFEVTVVYDNGDELSGKPFHVGLRFGPRIDITPLNSNRIKFGLRIGYDISSVIQEVSVGDDYHESESWSGRMMLNHTIPFGPVLMFGRQRSPTRAVFGTFFILNGPILGGDFRAAPAAKDYGAVSHDLGNTSYRGWRFDVGMGINGAFSNFLIGGDLSYSPAIIKMSDQIYENVDQDTSMHEITFNFHMGFFLP